MAERKALRNILLCATVIAITSTAHVSGYECPDEWPIHSCPQPGFDSDYTVCCRINEQYTCCSEDTLTAWAITLVVLAVVLVVGMLIALVLCCCGMCSACIDCCKPKRKQYVVISNEPVAGYTTTVYHSNYGAAPQAGFPQMQYQQGQQPQQQPPPQAQAAPLESKSGGFPV